jgi:hypothetical protein
MPGPAYPCPFAMWFIRLALFAVGLLLMDASLLLSQPQCARADTVLGTSKRRPRLHTSYDRFRDGTWIQSSSQGAAGWFDRQVSQLMLSANYSGRT